MYTMSGSLLISSSTHGGSGMLKREKNYYVTISILSFMAIIGHLIFLHLINENLTKLLFMIYVLSVDKGILFFQASIQ